MYSEGYTHIIKVKTIPEAWFQCVYDVFNDEKAWADVWRVDKGSYAGQLRREFKSILIEIENPCDPDLNARIPKTPEGKCIPNPIDPVIYPDIFCAECGELIKGFKMLNHQFLTTPCNHPVVKEFYEMCRPTCDQAVIKYFANYLFSDELASHEQYTYGSRIMEPVKVPMKIKDEDGDLKANPIYVILMRDFRSKIQHCGVEGLILIPQYYYLCAYLKTASKSNQIIMQIGKPSDVSLPDPPCLRQIDMQVKDGKLNWFIYFRSWELWGGLSLNLSGLSMLMDQMCVDTDLEPGKFVCHSKGLHLYEHSWSSALARLGRSSKG